MLFRLSLWARLSLALCPYHRTAPRTVCASAQSHRERERRPPLRGALIGAPHAAAVVESVLPGVRKRASPFGCGSARLVVVVVVSGQVNYNTYIPRVFTTHHLTYPVLQN